MKRSTLIAIVVVCLCVLVDGLAFYCVQRASYSRGTLQSARSITDVPTLGPCLEGFSASDIEYVCIRLYRHNKYFLTGKTSSESVESFVTRNRYMSLYKESFDQPPSEIEQVFREFPKSRVEKWPKNNWLMDGTLENETFIILAMDPATGQFWAYVLLHRGAASGRE